MNENKLITELFPMLWPNGVRKSKNNTEESFEDSIVSSVIDSNGCSECGEVQFHIETASIEMCLKCGNFVDYWFFGDETIEKSVREIMHDPKSSKVFEKFKKEVLWTNLHLVRIGQKIHHLSKRTGEYK